ncbi:hypothetical protein L2E82_14984 [Cichorium intybus]|uniref:Uncharacterized protein n=1 Tax=Cichorium intybus TaxID=13427 RepID=A0ACB9F2P7_CICIN|nr:hypothetical protein L2E82_14984 [Cichorium intybus]
MEESLTPVANRLLLYPVCTFRLLFLPLAFLPFPLSRITVFSLVPAKPRWRGRRVGFFFIPILNRTTPSRFHPFILQSADSLRHIMYAFSDTIDGRCIF